MGVIQQSLNNMISTTAQAVGIGKGVEAMKKQAAAEEKKATLQKLDAESDFLKGESERNQELENLNKFREQSKIDADKAAEDAANKEEAVDVFKGIFFPDDPEGQKIIRESEEKAKLAQAVAKAKQKEKLNNYRYVRERQQYLERQGQVAEERAKVYGLDINALKGGKK